MDIDSFNYFKLFIFLALVIYHDLLGKYKKRDTFREYTIKPSKIYLTVYRIYLSYVLFSLSYMEDKI